MTNYDRGVYKEQKIMHKGRMEGKFCIRSAGSHGEVDVVLIDPRARTIELIQSKPDDFPESQKKKLEADMQQFNGIFEVRFMVV